MVRICASTRFISRNKSVPDWRLEFPGNFANQIQHEWDEQERVVSARGSPVRHLTTSRLISTTNQEILMDSFKFVTEIVASALFLIIGIILNIQIFNFIQRYSSMAAQLYGITIIAIIPVLLIFCIIQAIPCFTIVFQGVVYRYNIYTPDERYLAQRILIDLTLALPLVFWFIRWAWTNSDV